MSATTAYERILNALRDRVPSVKANDRQGLANCPAHDDQHPSLGITRIEGSVLLNCRTQQCHIDDILTGLGLTARDLYDEPTGARYDYTDRAGTVTRTVHRTPDKRFRQSGLTKGTAELFRLPAVVEAVDAGRPVHVVEGEKDVLAVESAGGVATCSPMGAGKWHKIDPSPLRGAHVVVVPDRDAAGARHARDVCASLSGVAASLSVALPAVGKDAADHVAAGYGLDELVPAELPAADELASVDVVRERFPRLDLAALLAGERPPREWVIGGLVPAGASVSVVAPAGTGKSLLLLAAMLAVARGDRRFAGLPVTPRRVLLVDAENTTDDLADRLAALGVTADDAGGLERLAYIHLPPLAPLDTSTGALELAAILDSYGVRSGDVVVLDSLQRVIAGPENDSDTMRAYFRHTGAMLKRRGLTVVRTDNTGKDLERGARGSSGKRDDVDVELILTRDAGQPNQLRIQPGKTRLPGIEPLLLSADVDDETGRLTYTSAGDPFRAAVTAAHRVLDQLGVPFDAGERAAVKAVKASVHKVTRSVLRVAVRERKTPMSSAPLDNGALFGADPRDDRAGTERRTSAQSPTETTNVQVRAPLHRAAEVRRSDGAARPGAPADGAPPLLPSREGRTGARELKSLPNPPDHCIGCAVELSAERAGQHTYCGSCWERLLDDQPVSSGEAS